jgi:hypothetical protein
MKFNLVSRDSADAMPQMLPNNDNPAKRAMPPYIDLQEVPTNNMTISINLVKEEHGNAYIGYVLYNSTGVKIFASRFSKALTRFPDKGSFRTACYGIRVFTSEDQKFNVGASGQGTASSACPCPICTIQKSNFKDCLDPNKPKAALRTGDNSNYKLYEKFKKEAGVQESRIAEKSDERSMTFKRKYFSVVYKPALFTPPELNTASIMHVSQGLYTHLTTRIFGKLCDIDRDGPWLNEVSSALASGKEFKSKKDVDLEKAFRKDIKLSREQTVLEDLVSEAPDGNHVETRQHTLDAIQQERADLETRSAMHAKDNLKRSVAEFIIRGEKYLQKPGNKPVREAGYAFLKSYEVEASIRFRVEHSGLELTNADGIKVAEKCEEIAERCEKCYANNLELKARVKRIMEIYRKLGKLYFPISKFMKSQKKPTEDEIDSFESDVKAYA